MSSTTAFAIAMCAVGAIVIIFIVDAWRGSLTSNSERSVMSNMVTCVGRHKRRLMKPTKLLHWSRRNGVWEKLADA